MYAKQIACFLFAGALLVFYSSQANAAVTLPLPSRPRRGLFHDRAVKRERRTTSSSASASAIVNSDGTTVTKTSTTGNGRSRAFATVIPSAREVDSSVRTGNNFGKSSRKTVDSSVRQRRRITRRRRISSTTSVSSASASATANSNGTTSTQTSTTGNAVATASATIVPASEDSSVEERLLASGGLGENNGTVFGIATTTATAITVSNGSSGGFASGSAFASGSGASVSVFATVVATTSDGGDNSADVDVPMSSTMPSPDM